MERNCEHHFFVNVNAAHGNSVAIALKIKEIYEKRLGIDKVFIHFSVNGISDVDSKLLYLVNSPGKKVIYSVGGDGTLYSILNVIMPQILRSKDAFDKVTLCVLPGGTGNDFYRMLGVNFSKKPIDIIRVNDNFAAGIVSVGLDTEVAAFVNEAKKNGAGQKAYSEGIKRALRENNPFVARTIKYIDQNNQELLVPSKKIIVPEHLTKEEVNLTLLTACNGQFYGNGKHIGVGAKINDGLLKMVYADVLTKNELKVLLLLLLTSLHEYNNHVHTADVKEINILNPHNLIRINADGEIILTLDKVDISCLHNAINVCNDFTGEFEGVQKVLRHYSKTRYSKGV